MPTSEELRAALAVAELEEQLIADKDGDGATAELKLELLAETSERLRLQRLCEILSTVAAAVERQREIAERASTNGHVQTT